jgi:anti-sigma factor RsiW
MPHERFRNLLSDYLEESLEPADLRELEIHLKGCADCRLATARLRETLDQLRAFPRLEVPRHFLAQVVQRTRLSGRSVGPWENLWSWMGIPRLSPAAAAALLALPLIFLAGTRDGRRMTREVNMTMHQSYSNAVRLYSQRSDLRETAVAVGKRIPAQLEESMEWIRKRIEAERPEKAPRPKEEAPGQQSIRFMEKGPTA